MKKVYHTEKIWVNNMLKGIDVSTYQKSHLMDYDKIVQQIDFVIIRLGYTGSIDGVSWALDDQFKNHYREFSKRGVPIGIYWFSRANSPARAIAEANTVIKLVQDMNLKLEYPIWWDTEDKVYQAKVSRQVLTDTAKAFCQTLENAGYYSGIYAGLSWANTKLDMNQLKAHDFWLAQYNNVPTFNGKFGMWQHTRKGRLLGYDNDLDMNIAYRDYKAIITKAGLNNFPKEVEKPIEKPVEHQCLSLKEVEDVTRKVIKEELSKLKVVVEIGNT